jgi:hypothetical protein
MLPQKLIAGQPLAVSQGTITGINLPNNALVLRFSYRKLQGTSELASPTHFWPDAWAMRGVF